MAKIQIETARFFCNKRVFKFQWVIDKLFWLSHGALPHFGLTRNSTRAYNRKALRLEL